MQITGDKVTGDVYIAGMNEIGGGLTNRANKMYRSTDGGDTWTNTYTGPQFPGPGRSASGFFATMYTSPAYWRHRAGVSLPPSTMSLASSMPPATPVTVTPATSFTSAPPTAA